MEAGRHVAKSRDRHPDAGEVSRLRFFERGRASLLRLPWFKTLMATGASRPGPFGPVRS